VKTSISPSPAARVEALPAAETKFILHPTDLTPGSEKAFAVAVSLARKHGAELIIAHALPPPTPLFESESPHWAQAEAALASLADVAAEFGVSVRRVLIDSTAPVSQSIVRCAEEIHAGMIVMGTTGKTGISRWLVGSHAARVISRAQCPVVVVRAGAERC
jgi:nucleotide-binding universal stress UspA family protein